MMHTANARRQRLRCGDSVDEYSRRFRQRTEATRERDVVRYLLPWRESHKPKALERSPFSRGVEEPKPTPEPCPDRALLAFAQLAAVRLDARRAFVKLVSTHTVYVLAEATRTMSFQYESVKTEKDKPWIGTCSFPRDESVTHLAIDAWRSARYVREDPPDSDYWYTGGTSPHWHIVNGTRQDTACQKKAFTKHASWSRFYFSVPLRNAHGSVIGSFTVMDDRPRYGIHADEMSFMEDIADTISEHLHSTVVRSQRQRSERLIQALGLFNRGEDSLRQWWLDEQESQRLNAGRHADNAISPTEREAYGDAEFGYRLAPSGVDRALSHKGSRTEVSTGKRGPRPMEEGYRSANGDNGHEVGPTTMPERRKRAQIKASRSGDFDLTDAIEKTYNRASNLLREALGAHGVVFVDAHTISSALKRFESEDSDRRTSASESRLTGDSSVTDFSDSQLEHHMICAVHGLTQRQEDEVNEAKPKPKKFELPETYVRRLIKRYPQGHVFNFGDDGGLCSSGDGGSMSSGTDRSARARVKKGHGQRLLSVMSEARTIAFYPMWDETNNRWRSGLFVWSTAPLRAFDKQEDLTYLSSFGHSLMAELARLETLAADKAKGTFISSISHELRSPLHGVLAGVEFLQETQLSMFQQEMAHTVHRAGRTLLDTIDHLLDYSKISNFTSSQKRRRAKVDATRHKAALEGDPNEIGITFNVDLAQLTEEVLETVVSAHRFQHSSDRAPRTHAGTRTAHVTAETDSIKQKPRDNRLLETEELAVIVNIPWRKDWFAEIQAGSWTRILTNLVGNALKYTERGLVKVSLDVGEHADGTAADSYPVRLIVEDTGIGISESFLTNDLYTPFKQEDSHSTGTGLGLSIVKHIAKDMGADMNITSEIGKGTRVEIVLQAKFIAGSSSQSRSEKHPSNIVDPRSLGLQRFHLLERARDGATTNGMTALSASESVKTSVRKTCQDWFDCDIVSGPEIDEVCESTIYAMADDEVLALAESDSDFTSVTLKALADRKATLLVLGCSIRSMSIRNALEPYLVGPIFVHQPIGPQKLIRAVKYGQDPGSPHGTQTPEPEPEPYVSNRAVVSNEPTLSSDLIDRRDSFPWFGPDRGSPTTPGGSRVSTRPQPSRRPTNHLIRRSTGKSAMSVTSRDSSPEPSPPAPISEPAALEAGKYVLLVEDNEINMRLLVALMNKLKLQYRCASNGREALDLYRSSPTSFFLILMDLSMPVMDGYSSTAKIRETEKARQLSPVMIVALTGVTSEDSSQRAFGSGVDDYHTKPMNMRDVRKLVETAQGPGHT